LATWDELLEEFRALGGRAENVRLGEGALGRGLFSIDPNKPFLLQTPQNLLVNVADIVFENGALKVAADANIGARERKFFEDYHALISWGGGGREEIERIFAHVGALPAELRHKLSTHYHLGKWFDDGSPELIQQQFIGSRAFGGFERDVMMPMIELANHGLGCSYGTENGISLAGTASDEITVQYSGNDTYGLYRFWGFVCECRVAFSTELEGAIHGSRLFIERDLVWNSLGDKPVLPTLTNIGSALKLSFLMLGNRKLPRFCRGNFRAVFRSKGISDVDEAFDKIRLANQQFFLTLLADLENESGPVVHDLRRMARLQLMALTHCFGVREI
jgi:hypothetical protein